MKSRRNESRERETPVLKKIWFSGNFYYEMKFPFSEKFADFRVMLDNFLVSMKISHCRSELIVFLFYQKLNAIQSENSVFIGEYLLFCWLSKSVFTQNDHEFKNRELRKKFIFQQLGMKIANFANIR